MVKPLAVFDFRPSITAAPRFVRWGQKRCAAAIEGGFCADAHIGGARGIDVAFGHS